MRPQVSISTVDTLPGRERSTNDTNDTIDIGNDADADDFIEYDEFGFKIEVEDGPEHCSSKLLSTPFVDNQQLKLKWIAHLEFGLKSDKDSNSGSNRKERGLLAWETLMEGIERTDTMRCFFSLPRPGGRTWDPFGFYLLYLSIAVPKTTRLLHPQHNEVTTDFL